MSYSITTTLVGQGKTCSLPPTSVAVAAAVPKKGLVRSRSCPELRERYDVAEDTNFCPASIQTAVFEWLQKIPDAPPPIPHPRRHTLSVVVPRDAATIAREEADNEAWKTLMEDLAARDVDERVEDDTGGAEMPPGPFRPCSPTHEIGRESNWLYRER